MMKERITLRGAAVLLLGLMVMSSTRPDARAAGPQPPEISFAIHRSTEENVEGPNIERTYFMAGNQRIAFGQPKGCRLTNDDRGLLILLTDANLDGEIHVRRSPFTLEADLVADVLKFRDAAAIDVPRDANNVEVLPPVINPYPYNGWKSLGFTWTYSAYGRSLVRTVSYINLEIGAQIVVTTLAVKSDAEKVNKIAKQFMSSWWVMETR
jgi:hypothetical protein